MNFRNNPCSVCAFSPFLTIKKTEILRLPPRFYGFCNPTRSSTSIRTPSLTAIPTTAAEDSITKLYKHYQYSIPSIAKLSESLESLLGIEWNETSPQNSSIQLISQNPFITSISTRRTRVERVIRSSTLFANPFGIGLFAKVR